MTRNIAADLSEHGEHGEHGGHGPGHGSLEADVLAALWEQVPFPRLPCDAPAELKELVVDVENPRRVYNIHRASRRYYLQLLVERFVIQLRYGCGVSDCSTSSCFTCRKRLAGKAPIRRYNPTSARTLAVYLAGQDNPESRLCPNLQPPTGPSDSIKPLAFSPKHISPTNENKHRRINPTGQGHSQYDAPTEQLGTKLTHRAAEHASTKPRPISTTPRSRSTNHERLSEDAERKDELPNYTDFTEVRISEKAVTKDYRSFAANIFGTVAFKMLEWLTPNTLEAIAEKAEAALNGPGSLDDETTANPSPIDDPEELVSKPTVSSSTVKPRLRNSDPTEEDPDDHSVPPYASNGESGAESGRGCRLERQNSLESPTPRRRPSHSRKSSHARIRTSSLTKPPNKGTIDPILSDAGLPSPTTRPTHSEIVSKGLIRPSSNITRTSSQLSIDKGSEIELDEQTSASDARHLRQGERQPQTNAINGDDTANNVGVSLSPPDEDFDFDTAGDHLDSASELDKFLPQSLSRFSVQTVDFICDVLQEDATCETHLLEPPTISTHESAKYHSSQLSPWKRRRRSSKRYTQNLKLQWKLFIEQSIFNVLSDPRAVLESFTNRDGLIDSQSLWYCMLRLTRVAPNIVLDSLWITLSGLFAPPKPLQSPTSQTSKLFPRSGSSFTNAEAGFILSICLHALVATAPLVTDSRQLIDMSRIRAHGLTLTNGGAVARQATSICLQYEDAFTDDLALRLARRLLTMITARRRFDLLVEFDRDSERKRERDVVEIFLAHLESTSQSPLNVSKAERSMHEKRMPILILDWARAVMFNEWEGQADVPGDGPFGGALALTAAMCSCPPPVYSSRI